jgi:hypothetical protein
MVTAKWLIAPLAAVTAELIATFGTALALYHDYITALFAVHLLSPLIVQSNRCEYLPFFRAT